MALNLQLLCVCVCVCEIHFISVRFVYRQDDSEVQFDPNSFMQTMQKVFGKLRKVQLLTDNTVVI